MCVFKTTHFWWKFTGSQAPFYFHFSCELMEMHFVEWKLTKFDKLLQVIARSFSSFIHTYIRTYIHIYMHIHETDAYIAMYKRPCVANAKVAIAINAFIWNVLLWKFFSPLWACFVISVYLLFRLIVLAESFRLTSALCEGPRESWNSKHFVVVVGSTQMWEILHLLLDEVAIGGST